MTMDLLTLCFSSGEGDSARDIIQEFDETVKSLGDARNSLEQDIRDLRNELEDLKREKDVLDIDLNQSRDASGVAMAAKAAEDEKLDALKKNQELRSYLDSAAEKIKSFEMKSVEEQNEVKRLKSRIDALEEEKVSLVKERENLNSKTLSMNDMITEQDFKIKTLKLEVETSKDDKKNIEIELQSTKTALDDIQKSMIAIKDKIKSGDLDSVL